MSQDKEKFVNQIKDCAKKVQLIAIDNAFKILDILLENNKSPRRIDSVDGDCVCFLFIDQNSQQTIIDCYDNNEIVLGKSRLGAYRDGDLKIPPQILSMEKFDRNKFIELAKEIGLFD